MYNPEWFLTLSNSIPIISEKMKKNLKGRTLTDIRVTHFNPEEKDICLEFRFDDVVLLMLVSVDLEMGNPMQLKVVKEVITEL